MSYATIQRIQTVESIGGARHLEKVKIQDRTYVVEAGEFHAGDLCVAIKAGAIVPWETRYEFLRDMYQKRTPFLSGFLIQTKTFCGVKSDGLAMKPADFPELAGAPIAAGDDVAKKLGITSQDRLETRFNLSQNEAETLLSFYNCTLLMKTQGELQDIQDMYPDVKLFDEDNEEQKELLERLAASFNIRQRLKDGRLDNFTTDELFRITCDISFDIFELIRKDEDIDNISWIGRLCRIHDRAEDIWQNRKYLGWRDDRIV